MSTSESIAAQPATYQRVGLLLGPALGVLMLIIGPPDSMEPMAWRTAAIGIWMAVWWATEAVPVAVTALLPLVLFSPLGIRTINEAAAPFAHPTIFLFLGGFMIAAAIQRWNLHKRIALSILGVVGTESRRLVGGFMIASAALSMWMTNTSTTMMLLPIALSVVAVITAEVEEAADRRNFAVTLLLGVAYGATIGGVATLVGTPPNAFLAGFMEENYGVRIHFAQWMLVGLPVTVIMLPLGWVFLTRVIYPVRFEGTETVRAHLSTMRSELGVISKPEKRVAIVFVLVAFSWMFRSVISDVTGVKGLSDAGIAMAGAVSLFLIPSGASEGPMLMNWERMTKLPWGILLLFGGGLSLAGAVSGSGLAQWLGDSLAPLGAFGLPVLVIAAVALVIFLTELTSNLATTATFLPVVAAIAVEVGQAPIALTVPVALAASCAFMLPIATPPNAIVYGSEMITIPQMARAGLALNLIGIILLSMIALWLAPLVLS